MALTKLLRRSDGSTVSTTTTTSSGSDSEMPQDDHHVGRNILRRAVARVGEPALIPLDYLQQCLDMDEEGTTTDGVMRAYDAVLGQNFLVLPKTNDSFDTTQHPNLQRIYGYSDEYLVLEELTKGTVANFLKTPKGRVQLGAQRRITIMLNVAQIMLVFQTQGKTGNFISSRNIGITSSLTPKVLRLTGRPGDDDVYDFGILMIELLTGSLQNNGSEDRHFGDFGHRYTKAGGRIIEDDLDPYVRESWTFNILSQLNELALKCIQPQVEKRPCPIKLVATLTLISSRMRNIDNYDYY